MSVCGGRMSDSKSAFKKVVSVVGWVLCGGVLLASMGGCADSNGKLTPFSSEQIERGDETGQLSHRQPLEIGRDVVDTTVSAERAEYIRRGQRRVGEDYDVEPVDDSPSLVGHSTNSIHGMDVLYQKTGLSVEIKEDGRPNGPSTIGLSLAAIGRGDERKAAPPVRSA